MPVTVNLLFHMHHEPEDVRSTSHAYHEVLALTRQADQLPIDCVWLAETSADSGRLPAPLLFAVAAARETKRRARRSLCAGAAAACAAGFGRAGRGC